MKIILARSINIYVWIITYAPFDDPCSAILCVDFLLFISYLLKVQTMDVVYGLNIYKEKEELRFIKQIIISLKRKEIQKIFFYGFFCLRMNIYITVCACIYTILEIRVICAIYLTGKYSEKYKLMS